MGQYPNVVGAGEHFYGIGISDGRQRSPVLNERVAEGLRYDIMRRKVPSMFRSW